MCVNAVGGTFSQIRSLVKTVVKLWNEDKEARAGFKPELYVWL